MSARGPKPKNVNAKTDEPVSSKSDFRNLITKISGKFFRIFETKIELFWLFTGYRGETEKKKTVIIRSSRKTS